MKDFLAKFKFQAFYDTDSGKWQPRPLRDWKIIFCVSVFLAVAISVFHYVVFSYVSKDEKFFGINSSETQSVTSLSLDQKGLSKVAVSFKAKQDRMDEISKAPLKVSDPSGAVSIPASVTPSSSATKVPVVSVPGKVSPKGVK